MRRPHIATLVFWLLLAATALSWALSSAEGSAWLVEARAARLAIVLLAFFKVRLVLLHFMELATAPRALHAAAAHAHDPARSMARRISTPATPPHG